MKQDTKDIFRFFFTFLRGWLFFIGILLGFGAFVFMLGISLTNFKIFFIYYLLGVILSLIVLLAFGMILVNFILKKYSFYWIKKHENIKDPETIVILGYDGPKIIGNLFISTYLGITYLMRYLELKKNKFNIYITPTKKEVIKLIENNKTKVFYLVGHGSKRGFALNKKENIFYSDYSRSKLTKDEIHLYHCGHSEGKTLVDFLVRKENRKKCYFSNKKVMVISYILKFFDLYKSELNNLKIKK